MKRTVFGMATLLLLSATPCVVNAFTAIAWSESGQRGGSVKNAPTKEAAISAAIADCKKNGGESDCQVFKVTDEPGFVALYASCAKTCGVTAVTGRDTAEQARADGKRDCEAYHRNTCQLAQEWEEVLANGKPPTGQGTRWYDTLAGSLTEKDFYTGKEEKEFGETGNTQNFWYYPSRIRKQGNLVKLFILADFHHGPRLNDGTEIYSEAMIVEFDCSGEKFSTVGSALYKDNYAKGEIHRIVQNTPRKWTIVDKSLISSESRGAWKKACGKALSYDTPKMSAGNKGARRQNAAPQYTGPDDNERQFMIWKYQQDNQQCAQTTGYNECHMQVQEQLQNIMR
jgi:hypothetical protein